MKKIFIALKPVVLVIGLLFFASTADAQYLVNFEGEGEVKTAYASGDVILSGLTWNMTEALIGTLDADWKNGIRSARLRGYGTSVMTMLEDKENGIGNVSFYYRRYGTDAQVDWKVEYSLDGTVWAQIGNAFTAPASDDVQFFSEDVNVNGNIRIRIKRATEEGTSNRRLNIDDILITNFGGGNTTATPSFSPPAGQFFGPVTVAISCATPDASIFYTTDGSEPTQSSTPYTIPINITSTTLLKARAYAAGLDPSNIAQGTYTIVVPAQVANLAQLRAAFPSTNYFQLTGEVVLTFKQTFRNQKYIQDASAAILIDDVSGKINTNYNIGDGITGITGTIAEFGNMLQFTPALDPGAATSTGNQVVPQVITINQMLTNFENYESELVKIIGATFADAGSAFANGTVYEISDNSKASGNFRTTFYDVNYIGTTIPSGAGNIIGILNSRADGDYITSRFLEDFEWALGEPSNYPADFGATAYGQNIALTWTDATGNILPTSYLLLASDSPAITLPADGVPVANDPDLTDGSAAMNISFGAQQYMFTDLPVEETYYFKIFPYTGTGAVIDYKTDGNPPAANATTYQMVMVLFTTFNEDWEGWTQYNVTGEQDWDRDNTFGINNTPCAKISGFVSGTSYVNENWLISPLIESQEIETKLLSFYAAVGYSGPALQVKVSIDYDGSGNPNNFTWTDFSDQVTWPTGNPFFEWTHSGYIDVFLNSDDFYVAFVYYSTDEESATWEVDNIMISGELTVGISGSTKENSISIYPNPGNGLFYIHLQHDFDQLEVHSITGQLVHEQVLSDSIQLLDLTHLNKGFYMIRLSDSTSGLTLMRKIIIN
ncbi:MAG: chitobiase/beta-hexosaminidase C-terminal domain-containing protein [Bacteroidales bacterium]|nr:chitobiase/beta-hexosaminidase C-terminal domain-containing protein [Bacteroidales bacterium]